MGMFDTVNYKCPHCDHVMDIQTKSGICALEEYSASKDGTNLPPALMCALAEEHRSWCGTKEEDKIEGVSYNGPITCSHCGKKFKLFLVATPSAILKPISEDDEE